MLRVLVFVWYINHRSDYVHGLLLGLFLSFCFFFFLSLYPPDTVLILWPRTSLQKERVEPNNKTHPGCILYLFVRGTGAVVREGILKIQIPSQPAAAPCAPAPLPYPIAVPAPEWCSELE